jgi:hypothetical protein
MTSEKDIDKLASAARHLAPSTSAYLEENFVMNLLVVWRLPLHEETPSS